MTLKHFEEETATVEHSSCGQFYAYGFCFTCDHLVCNLYSWSIATLGHATNNSDMV